jgi:hypothetical protein
MASPLSSTRFCNRHMERGASHETYHLLRYGCVFREGPVGIRSLGFPHGGPLGFSLAMMSLESGHFVAMCGDVDCVRVRLRLLQAGKKESALRLAKQDPPSACRMPGKAHLS